MRGGSGIISIAQPVQQEFTCMIVAPHNKCCILEDLVVTTHECIHNNQLCVCSQNDGYFSELLFSSGGRYYVPRVWSIC